MKSSKITPIISLAVLWGVLFGISACDSYSAAQDKADQEMRQHYSAAYTEFNDLKAAAITICDIETLMYNSNSPSRLIPQVMDLRQRYYDTAAHYDAAYNKAFQVKSAGPADLPKTAPELSEAKTLYCYK